MKYKYLIFTLFSLHFTLLLSQSSTIIDTVSSISTLDASLTFNTQWGYWLGGAIMPNGPLGFGVGDSYSGYNGGDEIRRSFITFPVQEVPEGYTLISAKIVLWLQTMFGNSVHIQWPIWNIDGEEINYPMLLEHVDYGDSFETEDFYCDTLTSFVQELYTDSIHFFWEMDVTEPYIYNIETDSNYSQYRLRFPIDTDYDESNDYLGFVAKSYTYPEHNPKLMLLYESTSNYITEGLPESIVINSTNFPNPFNPSTIITYYLPESSHVSLEIYNLKGQKVKSLLNDNFEAGRHKVVWDGEDNDNKNSASGVYFYKLSVNGKSKDIKKMLLLK